MIRGQQAQPLQFGQGIVEHVDLVGGEFPARRFVPLRLARDFRVGEAQIAGAGAPVMPRCDGMAAHSVQGPAWKEYPADPNPPRPTDDVLVTPLPLLPIELAL
jgi:hypothetical protein